MRTGKVLRAVVDNLLLVAAAILSLARALTANYYSSLAFRLTAEREPIPVPKSLPRFIASLRYYVRVRLRLFLMSFDTGGPRKKLVTAERFGPEKINLSGVLLGVVSDGLEVRLSWYLGDHRSPGSEYLLVAGSATAALEQIREKAEAIGARTLILVCQHTRLRDKPLIKMINFIENRKKSIVYSALKFSNRLLDGWYLDDSAQLKQAAPLSAFRRVLSDRQTNGIPGLPIAISVDALRELENLDDADDLAATVVNLSVSLRGRGFEVWELRDRRALKHLGDREKCGAVFPSKPALCAQAMRGTFSDFNQGIEAPQAARPAKVSFLATLENSRPPGSFRTPGQPRILYLSPVASHPTDHGNRSTMVNFGRILHRAGYQTIFASPMDFDTTKNDLKIMEKFWGKISVLAPLPRPISHAEVEFDSWITQEFCAQVRQLVVEHEIDTVVCSYVWLSGALESLPRYVTRVLDTHDKFSYRHAVLEKQGLVKAFFSCTPDDEARYLSRADVVVARQQEEADYFQSISPNSRVAVVSHVTMPTELKRPTREGPIIFGFVGGRNQPNVEAVQNLLRGLCDVSFRKKIQLVIVGSVCGLIDKDLISVVMRLPAVSLTLRPFVEELSEFYESIDCVISPMTVGTGVNVKSLEAFAFGMPLLSTAKGSFGSGSTAERHNLSDVSSLIEAMGQMTRDQLPELSSESKRLGEELWEEHSRKFLSVMGALC